MKNVLLLVNSDRSCFSLARYLVLEGRIYGWKTFVASMFDHSLVEQLKEEKLSRELGFVQITNFMQSDHAIRKVDLVIAILPDPMLAYIINSCVVHKKTLITPAPLSQFVISRKRQLEENSTLILMECGFSPGLDHITLKSIIDNLHQKGGIISSVKTYSGSFIADHCANNPLHFKLTEPGSDIIDLGKGINRHILHGRIQHTPYNQLFERAEPVRVTGIKNLVGIPYGDSIFYRSAYQLADAHTIIKSKLMNREFVKFWSLIVKLGLVENTFNVDIPEIQSLNHFLDSFLPYSPLETIEDKLRKYASASSTDIEALRWLGLFGKDWKGERTERSPKSILLGLFEEKLELDAEDHDCIVMQHELQYLQKQNEHHVIATLVAQGENKTDTAVAKAKGLTIGAAAKACLLGNIKLKGLQIPTKKEIYEPILAELEDFGVTFHVESKIVDSNKKSKNALINLNDLTQK